MKDYFINAGIILSICCGLFLLLYKGGQVPQCLNADEAAFGYNAFSILKTAHDEHGALFPLRLASFNDFKLPLYSYLSMPFIAAFGLSDSVVRLPNIFLAVLMGYLFYHFLKKLFDSRVIATLGAFLISISPWMLFLVRQAHEGVVATVCILGAWLLYILAWDKKNIQFAIASLLVACLSTFGYHFGRFFLLIQLVLFCIFLWKQTGKKRKLLPTVGIVISAIALFLLPFIVDGSYGADRVAHLAFYRNEGFKLKIDEYRTESNNPIIFNKLTEGLKEVTDHYLQQISPEFLMITGDSNVRFGFPGIGFITPLEYLFLFLGLYYLFSHKQKYRYLLVFLLLVCPITNSLTWREPSVTRSFPMILPLLAIVSYGVIAAYEDASRKLSKKYVIWISIFLFGLFSFYRISSLYVYFFNYMKRPLVIREWQCGYKEVVHYIEKNNSKRKVYVTSRHGQPYIFLLYYLKFDPSSFQKQAVYSKPDENGFSTVLGFDKYVIGLPNKLDDKLALYIGYPDEFASRGIDESEIIQKVTYGSEQIFWIYSP